jgi:hypothetical protein
MIFDVKALPRFAHFSLSMGATSYVVLAVISIHNVSTTVSEMVSWYPYRGLGILGGQTRSSSDILIASKYNFFTLYGPVYAAFLLYPAMICTRRKENST